MGRRSEAVGIGTGRHLCTGLSGIWLGASEHPEELTDRCCLSALAGLSKYLPSLSAGGIIGAVLCYVKFFAKVYCPRALP